MATFHQLHCMRSFLTVAEHGSFARAAHALQIGAASVSEHVATLERHLGVALFHRTTRSLHLTHEGRTYLALCRDILPRIAETDARLARGDRPDRDVCMRLGEVELAMAAQKVDGHFGMASLKGAHRVEQIGVDSV